MKEIRISKTATEKVARFYPWAYDNEIIQCPGDMNRGELVRICSPSGLFLGTGYINLKSTIAVRILSFVERTIDEVFLREKITGAWERRRPLLAKTSACRVVHSEADDLAGLMVDYYDGFLTVQINTAGMENMRTGIITALVEVMKPGGIYERSDQRSREKEGLEAAEGVVYGQVPEEITIAEKNVRFLIRLRESQKTGFYLDQRRNREMVASYVRKGFSVLDVFSNTGGFGLHAASRGAGAVTLVDQSGPVLELAKENAKLNGFQNVSAVRADAFDYLDRAFKQGRHYHLVVLDPPSFTKKKGSKGGALKGYRRLVLDGLRLLNPEGYLAVFSCSYHVSLDDLKKASLEAAGEADCRLEILEHLFQDQDHPFILNIPQSQYLKGLLFRMASP